MREHAVEGPRDAGEIERVDEHWCVLDLAPAAGAPELGAEAGLLDGEPEVALLAGAQPGEPDALGDEESRKRRMFPAPPIGTTATPSAARLPPRLAASASTAS